MVTEAAQPKKKELGEWAVVRPATHPDSAYTKTRALLARVFTFHIRSSLPVVAGVQLVTRRDSLHRQDKSTRRLHRK